MRYLTEPFAFGALKRGRAVEQFLGPAGNSDRPGVCYVEVRPTRGGYEAYFRAVLDSDPQTYDLDSLPPLLDDEEEDFGLLLATAADPASALEAAESRTGATRARWVNQGMADHEYQDYVQAGRPTDAAPDGHPWPARQGPRPCG
ncbi:hypothetical protein ACFVWX_14740 [Streptomyces sp. NPDC058220]|uniref:hypothetical protein n=1 Tax=Streptomyces sp. NPDC058220 TaxID=3346387 RepID=UPI0036EBD1D0